MDPNTSNLASSKISLQNSTCEEWNSDVSLDEISLKQEIEYNIVDKLSKEEKKPLIIDLEPSCDDISNSIPSELPEILSQSDQKCIIQKKTISNSTEKDQSIEVEGKVNQRKNGTCEKLCVDSRRESLQQLQQQPFSGKHSALCSCESKLKKVFERHLDKHSGKVLFRCLYCQFQSMHLKDMIGHISNTHQIGSKMVQCDRVPKVEIPERICGVCLKVCDNFKAVEGDMKDVLDTVLPKTDITAIRDLVMCIHCTEMLIKCSGFKTTCLNSYNYIVSFANKRDGVKLNLRDVYLSKNEIIAEDQVICGFCMDSIRNCSAISLDVEEGEVMLKKMIEQCLPELDLSLIEKPVICASCHGSLENCFDFVTNCLLVEEKIKKYCETVDINSRGQIELSHLLQVTVRDVTTNEVNGNLVGTIKEEKQFCEERENADERIIDNGGDTYKSEQVFYGDSEDAVEEGEKFEGIKIEETFCVEKETYLKEENLYKIEDHEFFESEELGDIEMKIDEPDFVRFEDDLILPQAETTNAKQWKVIKINSELYKCNSCSYTAKHKPNVKRHLLVHKSSSETTMYQCYACPFQTKRKHSFKGHLRLHDNPSEVKLYECDSCLYLTRHKADLKTHQLIHKDPSKITMYRCNFCPYQSKWKKNLGKHLVTHKEFSEVTMYKCGSCSFQATYRKCIKKHLLTHNPSLTRYKCDVCSYRTIYKSDLDKHLLTHQNPSEVTVYSCDSCSYQSKYKADLKKHLLVHMDSSEITMYKCDVCSYQSRYKGGLNNHLLVHKTPSEVTIYSCDTCSYRSLYKAGLKRHSLVHMDSSEVTMYKCDLCSYQSKYKGGLKNHSLTHKNPSLYRCDTCSFQTKYTNSLKKHLLIHQK